MTTTYPYPTPVADPHAELEREFMTRYLHDRIPRAADLERLTPEAAHQLLVEASRYASGRLAELELRARLVADVHGVVHPGGQP